MEVEAALIELLNRVAATKTGSVLVDDEELRRWPDGAVAAMKLQRLLVKARPASSVVCPGCERECIMPVHTLPASGGAAASFVICDKRDDINRVTVSSDRLTQWRCDAKAIVRFIAACLGLRRIDQQRDESGLLNIGIATGEKRQQMLGLRLNGELCLLAADNSVRLAELIAYRDGQYSIDDCIIRQLVDSARTADRRYTPSAIRRESSKLNTQEMYERWRKAYRHLKASRPNMSDVWYAQQIGKLDIAANRRADTIRKHMKP